MYHGLIDHRPSARPIAITRTDTQALTLGPVEVQRRADGVRVEAAPDAAGSIQILLQARGSSVLAHGDRHVIVPAGHWQVYNPATWAISSGADAEQILVRFPLAALSSRLAGLLRGLPDAAFPLDGATRMALDVARSCLAQAAHIDATIGAALGESLLELAKLALINRIGPRGTTPVRETVRARIEAFVQRNLFDHELSIDMIAVRMKCTKRYLHKVFSDEQQTLSQFIWEQRLERCRADLERAECAGRSITEIAFGWGFSNAAHFSRSFRSRYGRSPRAHRLAHLG